MEIKHLKHHGGSIFEYEDQGFNFKYALRWFDNYDMVAFVFLSDIGKEHSDYQNVVHNFPMELKEELIRAMVISNE